MIWSIRMTWRNKFKESPECSEVDLGKNPGMSTFSGVQNRTKVKEKP